MKQRTLPYGASTYSKSCAAYGPDFPVIATHADGWRIFVEGRELCDMVMGLGSVILGHRHEFVDLAIRHQLTRGTTLSLGTAVEIAAASKVLDHFPAGHMLQWGVNGSDATTGAIRLARAITGKPTIFVAKDSYHGFHDWTLADTTRGFGIPSQWDGEAVGLIHRIDHPPSQGDRWAAAGVDVAAVVVEPDMHPEWLTPLRQWCTDNDAFLIADEVMTWQRYPQWTACAHYGVTPDLTCLGKSLANGMPVSAIVGPREFLRRFAPGPDPNAFFSCTWAGHPLSMAAVIATLDLMERGDGPRILWELANGLHGMLANILTRHSPSYGIGLGDPPWNRVYFGTEALGREFRRLMADRGVLLYSAHNLSLAHDDAAFERLLGAWEDVLEMWPEHLAELDARDEEEHAPGVMRR